MNRIVKIRECLANKFNNECLADEILSFSVEMKCNYGDFKNFLSYSFKVGFPGLVVRLDNHHKIYNLDVSRIKKLI